LTFTLILLYIRTVATPKRRDLQRQKNRLLGFLLPPPKNTPETSEVFFEGIARPGTGFHLFFDRWKLF
jgi:hypothetical protein